MLMLDGGKKLVVLQYDPLLNFLHTLLMADIASISSTEVMGYGNSVSLACSGTNTLSSIEGCVSIFTNATDILLPLDISPVQPITIACSVFYGHCLVFTMLPSDVSLSDTEAGFLKKIFYFWTVIIPFSVLYLLSASSPHRSRTSAMFA